MKAHLALPATFDNGTFARYVPFDDGRDVVVRRGSETSFHYGLEVGRREVTLGDETFPLIRYESLLTCGAGTTRHDVLMLPDTHVLFPIDRRGFTDAEIDRVLASIRLT